MNNTITFPTDMIKENLPKRSTHLFSLIQLMAYFR